MKVATLVVVFLKSRVIFIAILLDKQLKEVENFVVDIVSIILEEGLALNVYIFNMDA